MVSSPERSFRNTHLAREVRIEAPLSRLFDERISERCGAAVIHLEWDQLISVSPQRLVGIELRDLHWKAQLVKAELFGATEHARRSARSPEMQRLGASLQRHRAHQTDDADHMIGVEVREEHIGERKRNMVTHHLPLCSFAAVEQ